MSHGPQELANVSFAVVFQENQVLCSFVLKNTYIRDLITEKKKKKKKNRIPKLLLVVI